MFEHPLEAFARDSNCFIKFRLFRAAVIGSVVGAIIGTTVGIWSGSVLLGSGICFISAVVAGALFDFCAWPF